MKTQVTKRFLSCLLALAMLLSLLPAAAAAESDAIICDLQMEYMENPMGIEVATPRFSWRMESSTCGQKQTAYEILVASSEALLAENEADIWDSGKVESAQSVGPYRVSAVHIKIIVHYAFFRSIVRIANLQQPPPLRGAP